ncbi:glycosyltransferase family 4 protein [Desulforhabdus amnigena]|jgi:glycosyltransferase involved in cell wall biosynthesis|nr:glycosyltransferase family 4 protein [Desulforhabdus amnigena]
MIVGGAQDNTLQTVKKHDRSRYTVHLASNPEGVWSKLGREYADCFHSVPNLVNPIHPVCDLKAFRDILSLIRKERYDIVHTHSSKAGILGRFAARMAHVPVTVHTIHSFSFHDFMSPWKRNLFINIERACREMGDFYITVSERNRMEAIGLGLVHEDACQTVYSGIDFAKLDRPCDLAETRRQLGIPEGWRTIVMVGRLDPQKAPYYLIQAFSKVIEIHRNTLLIFAGEGELEESLKAQARRLEIADKVMFLGSRSDIPEILKVSDIFSLSSLWEGLGRSMTEAMLLGIPVVVPNIHGIPEIVLHNETGFLFSPGNVEELAAQLSYVLDHPEEGGRVGANGRALTRRLFDADHMVHNIERIYEMLLQRKLES